MALPITFPNVEGPGRLTEVVSFRKENISDEEVRRISDSDQESLLTHISSTECLMISPKSHPNSRLLDRICMGTRPKTGKSQL